VVRTKEIIEKVVVEHMGTPPVVTTAEQHTTRTTIMERDNRGNRMIGASSLPVLLQRAYGSFCSGETLGRAGITVWLNFAGECQQEEPPLKGCVDWCEYGVEQHSGASRGRRVYRNSCGRRSAHH
jgi:hypothetical protein